MESLYNLDSRQTISIQTLPRHTKDIKRLVIKQIKANLYHWQRLTKKEQKALAEQTIVELMADYNTEQSKPVPLHELTNMPDVPLGIIALPEMAR
jgi:hypothetical protein